MVIICHNSHEKLTKSKLDKVRSRFEHCSESLVYMKLYLVIICTKSHDKLSLNKTKYRRIVVNAGKQL